MLLGRRSLLPHLSLCCPPPLPLPPGWATRRVDLMRKVQARRRLPPGGGAAVNKVKNNQVRGGGGSPRESLPTRQSHNNESLPSSQTPPLRSPPYRESAPISSPQNLPCFSFCTFCFICSGASLDLGRALPTVPINHLLHLGLRRPPCARSLSKTSLLLGVILNL